jgi:hypothetical protein
MKYVEPRDERISWSHWGMFDPPYEFMPSWMRLSEQQHMRVYEIIFNPSYDSNYLHKLN